MKHLIKKINVVVLCLISTPLGAELVAPYFYNRSQGLDAARELAGWTQHVNLYDVGKVYGSFALTPEYTRSFRPSAIAQSLLGQGSCGRACPTVINVSGSHVAREETDWLADYFYLPTDYQSTLEFAPQIQNFLLDLNWYINFESLVNGLFFRLHVPLAWTRWDLNFCESIISTGTNSDDAGYFAPTAIPRSSLLKSFSQYACGNTITQVADITFDRLGFARFDRDSHTKLGVADMHAILGYNLVNAQDYHFGLGVRVAFPTGNSPEGNLLFEPIIGNGKHWELGAHVTTHGILWRNEEDALNYFGLYFDANITHMFNASQRRTFDLKSKPLSRYMIAERMGRPITDALVGADNTAGTNPQIPDAQFKNEFSPVANISTFNVKVSMAVQADLAAQFTYADHNFTWDIGYNFWGRSCEKIKRTGGCISSCAGTPEFAADTWALKGDAQVFGFASTAGAGAIPITQGQPVALSATESQATIHHGTNYPATGSVTMAQVDAGRRNPNVDYAHPAFAGSAQVPLFATTTLANDNINTSVPPQLISLCDIAFVGTRGISNKVYTQFTYSWLDHCRCIPFVGIGGQIEIGSKSSPQCDYNSRCAVSCVTQCDSSCINTAVTQWAVLLKGGVSF